MFISQRIRDLLEAQGFVDTDALAPTWYVGVELPEPDFTVTILPGQGEAPTRALGEQPQFTVRVRHELGDEANIMVRRIFQFLQEFQGRLGSPVLPVARIFANTTPVQLGRDGAGSRGGRWVVTQTYTAILRQVDLI